MGLGNVVLESESRLVASMVARLRAFALVR